MAPKMATSRLRKELLNLKKDPPPGILAEPEEADMLVWYFCIQGPVDTVYDGGTYVGKLKFPTQYPLKGPSIYMLTPSGRFQIQQRICMSMSDFHPEDWNPMWSVATIIQGVQSFMASEELTTGGLKSTTSERRCFATQSQSFNAQYFPTLFGGNMEAAWAEAEAARVKADASRLAAAEKSTRVPPPSLKKNKTTMPQKEPAVAQEATNPNESNTDQKLTAEELDKLEKRKARNKKRRSRQKAKKATDKAAAHADGDNSEEEKDD